jgi:type IV secretory pathway TrbF-like protein
MTEVQEAEQNQEHKQRELTEAQRKNLKRASRTAWNECFSDQIEAKKNWQRIAFVSMGITATSVIASWYLGTLPKQVAYVVPVDKLGHVGFTGSLRDQPLTPQLWDQIYLSQLEQYVRNWRTVTSDKSAQDSYWDQVYTMTGAGSQAKATLDAWYAAHDPVQRGGDGTTVRVSIDTTDREGAHTFGVWWTETATNGEGQATSRKYRCVFTFVPKDGIHLLVTELRPEEVHVPESHS